jgi:hypothetical protein
MGREKFADLRDEFEKIRRNSGWKTLYVYGTRGYGKSHLLAALVCVLAAREVKVVYIPDCREFIENPVLYMITAMLFAWADDMSKQQDIMALNTEEDINGFFRDQNDVVFVIDQLNALQTRKEDNKYTVKWKTHLSRWLGKLESSHKSILSSSANNHTFLNDVRKQSSQKMMDVYGGLTKVSLRSKNSFAERDTSNYDLDGNGMLVEVESPGRTRSLQSGECRRLHRLYPIVLDEMRHEGQEQREGQDQSENKIFQRRFR